MRALSCHQPPHLVVGRGCLAECAPQLAEAGARRAVVICGATRSSVAEALLDRLRVVEVAAVLWAEIAGEPTIDDFERALAAARDVGADTIIGLGGGSALDTAKLVAGLLDDPRPLRKVFGTGTLRPRRNRLVCVPTTAGTGSEVSPNAILLDERDQSKRAVISPWIVPDATYIDPLLARTMPRAITAATGLDALTHCIEAFANRRAHPLIDEYALAGIRLIGAHLRRAVDNGDDLEARDAMALGSLYGGLCLGPVNTAAVHALAYPLGGLFRVGHGLSNALMLTHVLDFNLAAAPERYATIAAALGAGPRLCAVDSARAGVERCRELTRECGLPQRLGELGIPRTSIPQLVDSALTVRRLLDNNPREVTAVDAAAIYERAFGPYDSARC
ncbi:MAG: iron-containing alcohol dehydrogenase [Luteitalea sp.]|nr:iron-containing alcohol dehydrogenase [Luteitalea sp.]